MISFDSRLGVRFVRSDLALFARRVWEHVRLRQVNPFEKITLRSSLKPRNYIDIVDISGSVPTITGLTLGHLFDGESAELSPNNVNELLRQVKRKSVQVWMGRVKYMSVNFSDQRAVRNAPAPFLPLDKTNPFLIEGPQCTLIAWLDDHRSEKATGRQWSRRIANLTKNGLRGEELAISRFRRILRLRKQRLRCVIEANNMKSLWCPKYPNICYKSHI